MVSFLTSFYYLVTDLISPPEVPGEQWRERARAEAILRARALEQSQAAYKSGRKSESKVLSDKGKRHGETVELYNARAAAAAFAFYNNNNAIVQSAAASRKALKGTRTGRTASPSTNPVDALSQIDLHGLFVKEALSYAEQHIKECRRKKVTRTVFITGRGNRSVDGVAKIKPAIIDLLQRKGVIVARDPSNDGIVIGIFEEDSQLPELMGTAGNPAVAILSDILSHKVLLPPARSSAPPLNPHTQPSESTTSMACVVKTLASQEAQRTVAVLGAAYGGSRAAQLLAAGLPKGWRVVLADRNTHCNHLYVLPRMAVLPGHEQKAFIPYNNVFFPERKPTDKVPEHPHLVIHGEITSLSTHSFTLQRLGSGPLNEDLSLPTKETICFDYAIYALGAQVPKPVDIWTHEGESHGRDIELGSISTTGSKVEGVDWLRASQDRIQAANSILLVGGGAMGIQFATDIKDIYPEKQVTLVHSRERLLPLYKQEVHDEVVATLKKLGVETILGERLDLDTARNHTFDTEGRRIVKTLKGREIGSDLVFLCTGQTPNTDLVREIAPEAIVKTTGEIAVTRTLQIARAKDVESSLASGLESKLQGLDLGNVGRQPVAGINAIENINGSGKFPEPAPLFPHILAVGDAVRAFGAIKAGHTAYYQAEVAAKNVLRLIELEGDSKGPKSRSPPTPEASNGFSLGTGSDEKVEQLIEYCPSQPAIKVSLGRKHYVGQMDGLVGTGDDGKDDLDALYIWRYFGADPTDVST